MADFSHGDSVGGRQMVASEVHSAMGMAATLVVVVVMVGVLVLVTTAAEHSPQRHSTRRKRLRTKS